MKGGIICAGCGALIFDGETFHVSRFIPSVRGLYRHVDTVKTPSGEEITITEMPTICAKTACLEAVLGDASWLRRDLNAERREQQERGRRRQAEFEAELRSERAGRAVWERAERERAAEYLAVVEALRSAITSPRGVSNDDLKAAVSLFLVVSKGDIERYREIVSRKPSDG